MQKFILFTFPTGHILPYKVILKSKSSRWEGQSPSLYCRGNLVICILWYFHLMERRLLRGIDNLVESFYGMLQPIVRSVRYRAALSYHFRLFGHFYWQILCTGYPPGESLYWGNTLNLWEIGQSEPIAELTIPGEPPNRYAMAYAPATNLLACGNRTDIKDWQENDPENGAVYVWDVARGQMQHIFRGKHTDSINYVRFSLDGTRLISTDDDTRCLWDVMCGEEIGEFPENFEMHGGSFDDAHIKSLQEDFEELTHFVPLVFSPCENLIAGHFSYDRILVWDIEQCEARMIIHKPPTADGEIPMVDPIEISPCGQYLAYGEIWFPGGVEKVPVRLWDISTGENIATFLGHPTDIQCLAFSPDSTILASGGFDGVIYLWDLKPYLVKYMSF